MKGTQNFCINYCNSPPTESKPLAEQKPYRMDKEELLDYIEELQIREFDLPSIDELEDMVNFSRAELQRMLLSHDEL